MGSQGVVIQKVPSRLDSSDLLAFRRNVQPVLDSDSPQLVLDLSGVKYMGSSGIEFLLDCLSQVVRRDGDLKFAALSPESASLLALTRVDRFFEIFRTVEDAVNSFDAFVAEKEKFSEPWNAFGTAALKDRAASTD